MPCEQTVNKCYLESTSNSLVWSVCWKFHSIYQPQIDIHIDHNQSSSCELSSEEESSCEELSSEKERRNIIFQNGCRYYVLHVCTSVQKCSDAHA